jgi:hypothetical protein
MPNTPSQSQLLQVITMLYTTFFGFQICQNVSLAQWFPLLNSMSFPRCSSLTLKAKSIPALYLRSCTQSQSGVQALTHRRSLYQKRNQTTISLSILMIRLWIKKNLRFDLIFLITIDPLQQTQANHHVGTNF